ncbi:hypothetical protein QCA50_008421 [Cerrena zonata]|uniref:FAD dependent oxidoreductase domain-containing protein n=1 Tax=Cerrena zonata TaxID=2478898 RepID=A0AAW0GEM0_9APHY
MAKRLIQFRLAHYEEVYSAAVSEDILEYCQCRKTETFDVHTTSQGFEEAKQGLDAWKAAMPAEASSWKVSEGNVASSKFGLASSIAGCIHGDGGAVHPYRFVTGLLSKLLERHPDNFFLSCNNPCTSIDPSSPFSRLYTVHTPKGSVTTPHIIHATNGWVSHLVTPLRKKILPLRGTMSTQRPGHDAQR